MHDPSAFLWIAAGLIVAGVVVNAQRDQPRTVAERSQYTETSRYEDVRTFLDALTKDPHARVETFGTTEEGRTLPLLVVGDPPARVPETDKPIVLVMANIHAGEVEGKEASLHLARRLLDAELQPLRGSAVWLFAPIYNADGNERISVQNRPEQNGPIAGVGTRENAKGLDLNRDFVKLESSEARSLVGLMTRWDPDVIVDLHTTNGSYHGYHLTYATGLNPNTDEHLTAFARERLLPAVREAMRARHQFRVFDYGNFAHVDALDEELEGFTRDEVRKKAWRTFDERPRFGTNYIGLRNRIAILSEAYSYLDFERRVKVTEAFVEEIMRYVALHAREVNELTKRADSGWSRNAATTEQGIAFELRSLPQPVGVLVGAASRTPNPRSGHPMTTMVENVATPTEMAVYDRFATTAARRVPREYIVQSSTPGVLDTIGRTLRAHGVRVETNPSPARRVVEQFIVDDVKHADRLFQGHTETSVIGRFERADVEISGGSLIVRTDQPLGRLVFYLLEPESNDSLATWNALDPDLVPGHVHPVLKVP